MSRRVFIAIGAALFVGACGSAAGTDAAPSSTTVPLEQTTSTSPTLTTSTTAATTTSQATTTTLPPVDWPTDVEDPVDPEMIRFSLSATPLGDQSWGQTQTGGEIFQNGDVPTTGISLDGELRFGVVDAGPGGSFRAVRFAAAASDPTTVGGIRTETAHYDLPHERTFWQALRLTHDDWSDTTDSQIVFQWHGPDVADAPGAPVLAFYVDGAELTVTVRTNADASPSDATNLTVRLLEEERSPFLERWEDVVIQARLSPFLENDPFVRIWFGDELVIDYDGPLGYNVAERNYAKLGYYHWLNADNAWDQSVPERHVDIGYMAVIEDPDGVLEHEVVRDHLLANLTVAEGP